MLNLKDLTAVSGERRTTFSRFAGRGKRGGGNRLIRKWFDTSILRRRGEHFLNLKDLLTVLSPSRRTTFSVCVRRRRCRHCYLLIPQRLMANSTRRAGKGPLNLKDLLTVFPPGGGATFSGFARQSKRGKAYLLIPEGLLARLPGRTDEGLLNLKGLLIVLSPSLERSFESESRFQASFLCRIAPNSAIFRQKRPDNGSKSGPFATDFTGTWNALRLVPSRGRCLPSVLVKPRSQEMKFTLREAESGRTPFHFAKGISHNSDGGAFSCLIYRPFVPTLTRCCAKCRQRRSITSAGV